MGMGNTSYSSSSSSSSGSATLMRWNSPIPYLFGGLTLLMGLIAIALIVLACSFRKKQPSSDAGKGTETDAVAVEDDGPRFVVIMAGDDKPTYIAMPVAAMSAATSAINPPPPPPPPPHEPEV